MRFCPPAHNPKKNCLIRCLGLVQSRKEVLEEVLNVCSPQTTLNDILTSVLAMHPKSPRGNTPPGTLGDCLSASKRSPQSLSLPMVCHPLHHLLSRGSEVGSLSCHEQNPVLLSSFSYVVFSSMEK